MKVQIDIDTTGLSPTQLRQLESDAEIMRLAEALGSAVRARAARLVEGQAGRSQSRAGVSYGRVTEVAPFDSAVIR
jgi:hypothetical protein